MSNISKTLLFFGNERLVSGLKSTDAPILSGLIERGYKIKAVISHHSDTKSRNSRPLEVANIAEQHGIDVLLPSKPMDAYDQLKAYNADAAILVAYGKIIPQSIIDLFPLGIINIHPSLLPRYRGPTPIETPIVLGDSSTGVSIMQLTAGMDDGPVYAQRAFPIAPTDTKFDVYKHAESISSTLLFERLPDILSGALQPTPQSVADVSYSKLLDKSDGLLDPLRDTAQQAERKVRAYLEFPKTKLELLGELRVITKAHTSHEQKTSPEISVMFSDGNYLVIDELIAPSGKRVDSASFLRGHTAS